MTVARDRDEEQTWSMRTWWFHLRTLTIIGHELGENLESLSDELLRKGVSIPLSPRDRVVMCKEVV
jgi:hypothetical protein